MKKVILITSLVLATLSIKAQDQLYKVTLLRAKPGVLLDLIDTIKSDLNTFEEYLEYQPYLLRHTQGDHWDLMLIYPIEELGTYFSQASLDKRSQSTSLEQSYGSAFHDLVSFQEEAIVKGPEVAAFQQAFASYELFHIEIFTALAGKQQELLAQREAENRFYAGIDHRPNFIFTRVFGPSWDNFTVGFYADFHDFAGPEVSFEEENKAAVDAGFEGVNFIGSYLRSLLDTHRDTFAWKVSE